MEPQRVVELVVFKLRDGVARERFERTLDTVSAWIREQPGFVSRELSYDAEADRCIEIVWWETMEQAGAAAELAMSSDTCAPMFEAIDMESALMLHGELALAVGRSADSRTGAAA